MKVYYNLQEFTKPKNAIVTSGTFDGVHLGHQKILQRLITLCQGSDGESVVITFWPHPRIVLFPYQTDLQLLTTIDEKIALFEQTGIDHLIIIPFTKEFASLDSNSFIKDILIDQIGTKKLVIGYDHKFGKNREGSFEYLKAHEKELNIEVEEIPRQDIDSSGISSTAIRKFLFKAEVRQAAKLLGRHYSLEGKITTGDKIGRTIGFPTANIELDDPHKLIPQDGAYAVTVTINGNKHNGMLNIGIRPTVSGMKKTIEVNIFDFDQDIYGHTIKVAFIQNIRNEQKFEGLEQLKAQLHTDRQKAIDLLNDYENL